MKKKEKKNPNDRKKTLSSLLKINSKEEKSTEEVAEVVEVPNEELQMDMMQQQEEEPPTPLQIFLSDTYSGESIYLIEEALKSEELEAIMDIDPHRGPQKKIKIGCSLAKTLMSQFQEIGITTVTIPATTAARVCMANHYKEVIQNALREKSGNSISEVSFDVFDDGTIDGVKSLSYMCSFTAYFLIKLRNHYIPLISLNGSGNIKEEALKAMEMYTNDSFVIRVSFKMIYAFQGPSAATFTKDGEIGLRNIMISAANYVINDILHHDETIQRMELDTDRILSDEIIFKEVGEYENNFSGKISWKKNEYTMFDPSVNKLAVRGFDEEFGTVTGNIDFSDDIAQLMYKY